MFIIRAQIKESIGKLSRRQCSAAPANKATVYGNITACLQVLASPPATPRYRPTDAKFQNKCSITI